MLLVHVEGVLAEEELRETGGANLTIDGYYDLVLAATGNPKTAAHSARARRAEILRRGGTPV